MHWQKGERSLTAYVVIFAAMLLLFLHLTSTAVRKIAEKAASAGIGLPVVVLDAGHGGEDGGTSGGGLLEKDVNLAITKSLGDLLTAQGYEVVLLRDTDVDFGDHSLQTVRERKTSDLRRRAELVNGSGNCILVSVHQNYFEQSQYKGTQVFYAANNAGSDFLAACIQNGVTGHLQPNNARETKPAENIYLLEHVSVPAVIVECGFLSNPEEAALLAEEEYQKQMALCIFRGVCNYLDSTEETTAWFQIPG